MANRYVEKPNRVLRCVNGAGVAKVSMALEMASWSRCVLSQVYIGEMKDMALGPAHLGLIFSSAPFPLCERGQVHISF